MKRRRLTTLVLAGMLTVASFEAALSQEISTSPPDIPATVQIDTVVAQPGTDVSVPILLTENSIAITGLTLPIHFDATRLTFSSVDYSGSVLPPDWYTANHISGLDTLKIIMFPDFSTGTLSHITASNGLLAVLKFQVNNSAAPGLAPIEALDFADTIITVSYDTTFSPDFRVDTLWDSLIVRTYPQVADSIAVQDYQLGVGNGAVLVQMPTAVEDNGGAGLPAQFGLAQNYPNPFNPTTTISFSIPRAGHVQLEVFNVLGQKVETLLDRNLGAGNHQVEFDASAQPSGVYFYRLTAGQGVTTRKMVLLK
jgi:hypothetical protein